MLFLWAHRTHFYGCSFINLLTIWACIIAMSHANGSSHTNAYSLQLCVYVCACALACAIWRILVKIKIKFSIIGQLWWLSTHGLLHFHRLPLQLCWFIFGDFNFGNAKLPHIMWVHRLGDNVRAYVRDLDSHLTIRTRFILHFVMFSELFQFHDVFWAGS